MGAWGALQKNLHSAQPGSDVNGGHVASELRRRRVFANARSDLQVENARATIRWRHVLEKHEALGRFGHSIVTGSVLANVSGRTSFKAPLSVGKGLRICVLSSTFKLIDMRSIRRSTRVNHCQGSEQDGWFRLPLEQAYCRHRFPINCRDYDHNSRNCSRKTIEIAEFS